MEEIFIFAEKTLDEYLKQAFTKSLLLYIFQAFRFNKSEFQSFTKKLPKMTGIVSGSLYERLIKEGMEKGMEKGVYKKSIIAIRNMTIKKLDVDTIAEFLSVEPAFVHQIQKELQAEDKIIALLAQKKTIQQVAKKLKVSEWLVEVLKNIREEREDKGKKEV